MKKYVIPIGLVLAAILGCLIQLSVTIDPFVVQLGIIPAFVIGIGVLSAYYLKNLVIAPFVTFLLNFIYNFVSHSYFYPGKAIMSEYLFGWSFAFPFLSFVIASIVFIRFRMKGFHGAVYMRIVKTFSFWFVFVSIVVSYLNFIGQDDKNLLFFFLGFEPILYKLVYTELFRDFIIDEEVGILPFGYGLRIAIGLLYGLILDLLVYFMKKRKG